MTPERALEETRVSFPFANYFDFGGQPSSAYLTIANTVERLLPSGSSILDFGCGPCDKTAILSRMGYRCSGFDDLNDAWHRQEDNYAVIHRYAKEAGIELVDSGDFGVFDGHQFDMVMAHDVLEHLHDSPRELLERLVGLLRPGGLVYVSVPNAVNLRKRIRVLSGGTNHPPYGDYYWYPGPWRGHVREYVKGDLRTLADALNLDVLELNGCDHMLASLSTNRLVQKAWKVATSKADSLKDSVYLVAAKPPSWEPETAPKQLLDTFLHPHSA